MSYSESEASAVRDVDALKAALRALVEALDAADPYMKPIYQSAMVHGVRYEGPYYNQELDAARALVQSLEPSE